MEREAIVKGKSEIREGGGGKEIRKLTEKNGGHGGGGQGRGGGVSVKAR